MKKPFPHILQTPSWGRAKQEAISAWTPFFFVRRSGSPSFEQASAIGDLATLESAILILERRLRFKQKLHYIPRGPWVDWADREAVHGVLDFVKDFAKKRKALFVRLEPDVYDREFDYKLMKNEGFIQTPEYVQANDTVKVLIAKEDEELLDSFHKKHRYNIKLAEKRGCTVRTSTDQEDVAHFYRLLEKTEQRHSGALHIHPLSYYEKVLAVLAEDNMARLYLVEKDGAVISASLVFTYGEEAIYMFGASDYEYRRDMPNHLREWHSMCDARAEGRKFFDLWGVTMRNDPDGGIKRYKLGYCERVENMAGTFDWTARKLAYGLFTLVDKIRRRPAAASG
jgi:lipid II:glycine glycyltransferase (peptidoglycan interpeptide bridge formation enzyme)